MFKIGYRTAKTALGTAIAISIANLFQLHNFASAGILTILCIQVTKKRSLKTSWERFAACVLAIPFSFAFFESFGYHPFTIGLLLLLFIPTTVYLKITDGVVTSSVIILHFFSARHFEWSLVFNEIAIISIGIGVALAVNLYMPSVERDLKIYREKIENNFSLIFKEMVLYLRNKDSSWKGEEITETAGLLGKAKTLAFRDVENHFLRNESQYYQYFKMRETQFEILERVLPIVTSISLSVEQGDMIADFIEELSKSVHPGNTAVKYLKQLEQMRAIFKSMPLPQTREEFEARAALFHFLREMEQYLQLKNSFSGIQ